MLIKKPFQPGRSNSRKRSSISPAKGFLDPSNITRGGGNIRSNTGSKITTRKPRRGGAISSGFRF